jgi:hypothetical protein
VQDVSRSAVLGVVGSRCRRLLSSRYGRPFGARSAEAFWSRGAEGSSELEVPTLRSRSIDGSSDLPVRRLLKPRHGRFFGVGGAKGSLSWRVDGFGTGRVEALRSGGAESSGAEASNVAQKAGSEKAQKLVQVGSLAFRGESARLLGANALEASR